jgi:monofunctional biosynthetic peptidoglycan transglycosylase
MKKMNKGVKKYLNWLFKGIVGFFIVSICSVIVFRFVPVPFTLLMLQRCIEQKMDGHPMKLQKDWVSRDEMSPSLELAVFCAEDQKFLEHEGFDFEAIDKALDYNQKQALKKHPKMRGASTISQQTAKNVFLWPGRSWLRKGLEVYFTFLIEKIWSKERIMEVYLNVIEFGDGVYGVEAASQNYFHVSAKKVTPSQAALMAIVLPNPRKFDLAKPTAYMQKRKGWVLKQMSYQGGSIDYSEEEKVKEASTFKEEKAALKLLNKKKKTK